MHGVLVDVYRMGVLLIGDSGIGKSSARSIIRRGRGWSPMTWWNPQAPTAPWSDATEMIATMELRGIGIINIKNLFGVSAVHVKSIELVIEPSGIRRSNTTGSVDGETYSILGKARPFLRLPVASGRNLALLIEIGARNELLKMQGYDAAKEFALKVDEQIAKNAQSPVRRR